MNVLITGGAGYIGSHVVIELIRTGYHVVVLDNLSRGHSTVAETLKDVKFVWGDIENKKLVSGLLNQHDIRAVIHFAAYSIVGESVACPFIYYQNNVVKGLSLLNTVKESGIPYFIFSSTAAVFGDPQQIPIPEEHPTIPTNPYGATKLVFEQALRWYGEAYGLKYTILRYFNAAGADPEGNLGENHQPETHLIPLVLQTALGLQPSLTIFGTDYPTSDGTCIRDYIHVTDLAVAHVLALQSLEKGHNSTIYNIGNEQGYSVQEVIEAARKITGKAIPVLKGPRRQGDPAILIASSRRIKDALGWRPRYSELETIILSAWEWQQKHNQVK